MQAEIVRNRTFNYTDILRGILFRDCTKSFFSIEGKNPRKRGFCSFRIIHDSSSLGDFLSNTIHFATGNLTNYLPTTFRVRIRLSRVETFDYAANNRHAKIHFPPAWPKGGFVSEVFHDKRMIEIFLSSVFPRPFSNDSCKSVVSERY